MRQNISLVVGIARIESRAEIAGTAIAVVPSAPVHPDTVTHGHGDTVAVHVASVYACLVVAVYGDWVLS